VKLLLDTHILLWWLTEPQKLGKKIDASIADISNEVWISVATIWELSIKHKLGRIELPHNFIEILHAEKVQILPIATQHALAIIDLPMIHQDPFDRMLIAQAKCEDLVLVTKDTMIKKYSHDYDFSIMSI